MRAILLINLGSPKSTAVADVRSYLNEFLMDRHVIDVPWPVRRAIVSFTVLPKRPAQTARAYERIWTSDGSPLLTNSEALRAALSTELNLPVWLAMRYGEPSIKRVMADIHRSGATRMLLVPLYPQHADSTRTTAIEAVQLLLERQGLWAKLRVLGAFHADAGYLDALAEHMRAHIASAEHVLFSYHGLPERQIRNADPTKQHCLQRQDCCEQQSRAHDTCYRQQCYATTRALVQRLGLTEGRYSQSFQSRLGRQAWLQPYTDAALRTLPGQGVRRLAVVCPGFVADNLETLEEIGMRGRDEFIAAGGESLTLVPCLNDDPRWVSALARLIANTP